MNATFRRGVAALVAVCAATALVGCAGYQSSYRRATAAGGELVWGYDDGYQVRRDGRVVASSGSWGGLAGATRCVPQASSWADSASSRDTLGKIILWTGAVIMLGAVAGGTYLVLDDFNDTDQMLTGFGVMLGGLVIGLITLPTGAVMRARAETQAIDAFNLYNDELLAGRCR